MSERERGGHYVTAKNTWLAVRKSRAWRRTRGRDGGGRRLPALILDQVAAPDQRTESLSVHASVLRVFYFQVLIFIKVKNVCLVSQMD